jgi:hypothetical protein
MGIGMRNLSRVDALFYYRTENRFAIRFAANCTEIRMGNRIRVAGPKLTLKLVLH